jgi:hypothetical protein
MYWTGFDPVKKIYFFLFLIVFFFKKKLVFNIIQ